MNKKYIFSKFLIVLLAIGSTGIVFAAEHSLYTLSGFVDLLIDMGVIPESNVQKAHDMIASIEFSESNESDEVQNSDSLEVSVIQYIEDASLTFNRFENIKGLLLIAKNTSDTALTFEAKRGCQVVYRIYSETDDLLYDSSTEKKCDTNEIVTYMLEAGKSRLFEVTHVRNKYTLQKGVYRFVLEYPGYGEGEREVTIK